jgi:ferrochelatase
MATTTSAPASRGAATAGAAPPVAVIGMNLGGPASLDDVRPFLQRLFGDPDVIQLGWARPLLPLLAWAIARKRAPLSREAYAQIGGRSPIREETTAQVQAVAAELARRGIAVEPAIAMAAWHPLADETIADLAAKGIRRAVALPLYPQQSRTTTGSSLGQLEKARAKRQARSGELFELASVLRYPDAPGYIQALVERAEEAIATLPEEHRHSAPVLFSAHGLPEAYIRRGDPYLDDVRITVEAVSRRLALGARAQLCFQSRVGPQRWLGPTTEETLDKLAQAGERAVAVVPVAFTGEHIETLQEIDILYKDRALQAGIVHFARARTVGCHPAFIGALADLVEAALRERAWI